MKTPEFLRKKRFNVFNYKGKSRIYHELSSFLLLWMCASHQHLLCLIERYLRRMCCTLCIKMVTDFVSRGIVADGSIHNLSKKANFKTIRLYITKLSLISLLTNMLLISKINTNQNLKIYSLNNNNRQIDRQI